MPVQTYRPVDGGQLVTRAASVDVGVRNYVRKRNWRRDLSDEMRREGWDYFSPLGQVGDYQTHPFPGEAAPLRVIHVVRRPNGDSCVVAGTASTLYRFNTDLSGYTVANYAADGYFETPTRWQVIGSGFSANGKRWEVADVDGTTVFNNAVDLPVGFRQEWRFAQPLVELREQGVISVGTIAEINTVLMGADVTEIQNQDVDAILGTVKSGTITLNQVGAKRSHGTSTGTVVSSSHPVFVIGDVGRVIVWATGHRQRITGFTSATEVTVAAGNTFLGSTSFRVTDEVGDATWDAFAVRSSASFFTSPMVGKSLTWADGTTRRIVWVISPTLARVDLDGAIAAGEVTTENPFAFLSEEALRGYGFQFDRRSYRVLWSEVGEPMRFASSLAASYEVGSNRYRLTRALRSLKPFDEVTVVGAGPSGGALVQARVLSVGPGQIRLNIAASTGGSGQIQRSSSVGAIVGYDDIQDDASAILKMRQLAGRMVIYTATNIYVGTYSGVPEKPFAFERIVVPHGRSLYFRNTLAAIGDTAHIFAGKDRFYRFDLTSRQPQPIPSADLVANLFFDKARIEDTELIFAVDNHRTQEIWLVCPDADLPTLCYDYVYQTFSSIDWAPTAACTCKQKTLGAQSELGDWFLMGTSAGVLLQYGLATEPVAAWTVQNPQAWQDGRRIYFRREARPYNNTKVGYVSTLSSGLTHFDDSVGEKELERYVVALSSLPQVVGTDLPNITVRFYTALNQEGPATLLGTVGIVDSSKHGMIPLHSIAHLFADEIEVTGIDNPVRLHSRSFLFYRIDSRSTHRQ